jgi:hypothetical protein
MFEQTDGGIEFGTRLARQAQEDAAFRQQLLADPKAAVEQELGRAVALAGTVPADERGAQDLYLVLPLSSAVLASAAGDPVPAPAPMPMPTDDPIPGYPPPCFDCIGQGCFDEATG